MQIRVLTPWPSVAGPASTPGPLQLALPPTQEPPPDTARSVRLMSELGMSPEEIAGRLNGTRHTAGIDDRRLAEQVVSVALAEIEAQRDPRRCRDTFQEFFNTVRLYTQSQKPLATDDLIAFIGTVDAGLAVEIALGIRDKRLRVEPLPGADFDAMIRNWGEAPSCCFSFYDGEEEIPTIFIRALDVSRPSFGENLERCLGLVHEARHWRDFTGNPPLRIPRFFGQRKMRYVSEILAYQEEHRFLLRLGNFRMSDRARTKGMTLAESLRDRVYREYFGWRLMDRVWNRMKK